MSLYKAELYNDYNVGLFMTKTSRDIYDIHDQLYAQCNISTINKDINNEISTTKLG